MSKDANTGLSPRPFGALLLCLGMLCIVASQPVHRMAGVLAGMSDDFWAGVLLGVGIVALTASIALNVGVICSRAPPASRR